MSRELINELGRLSVVDRLAVLAHVIVDDEPTADAAIIALIRVAAIMARHLPVERRAAIAFQLTAEATNLGAKWN